MAVRFYTTGNYGSSTYGGETATGSLYLTGEARDLEAPQLRPQPPSVRLQAPAAERPQPPAVRLQTPTTRL